MRSPPPKFLAALAAFLPLAGLGGCSPAPAPKGVLLISIDSLRADHLSAYGYRSKTRPGEPTSPAIDRLMAEEGALFERAMSTTSWTLPSHLAMLTGLPNEVHGVRDLPDRLPPDRRLITEAFQRAGWRTFGIWSGPNVHPWFGFERGMDLYVDASTSSATHPDAPFGAEQGTDWDSVRDMHGASHRGITGPAIRAAFSDFAGSLGDERFFAFVHMWDVHYDYNAPAEFDRFFPGYEGPIDGQDFQGLAASGTTLNSQDLARLLSLYDAEIRYTDHNIERMLGELAERGRLDNTLVIVTSDHGEEFLEHGALGHKASLYEEVLHIPLLVRYPPAVLPGRRYGGLVSILDLAPTIADWCDLAFPVTYGRSLRPVLEGRAAPDVRPVPLELTVRPVAVELRGVHYGDHKWVRFAPDKQPLLYDLAADPKELRGRPPRELTPSDPRPDRALALWAQLDADAALLLRAEAGELPGALSRDLEKAGYLGGGAPTPAPGGER